MLLYSLITLSVQQPELKERLRKKFLSKKLHVLLLLKKTPYKLSEQEIISLNRQSTIKNRFARIIEIDE